MADREVGNCKQRWSKISDQVSKFVGSLRAATSQQSSGQNDNDVMKLANEIYHHDYGAKDGSQAFVQSSSHEDQEEARRKGVKKEKARLKAQMSAKEIATSSKSVEKLEKLQEIFEIRKQDHELKKQDFEMKEKINKQHMLETLLAKKELLSEIEMALKNKLISDMLL
ncbi:PREDICTED: uncharacterized protein LOC106309231 [Brassica oleracea var. oleracea]|nr:PREDICTED: uncharacterized protein LOC106309231 [Brassica oleracea var. oleracea]